MRNQPTQWGCQLAAGILLVALIWGGVHVLDGWALARNQARLEESAGRALPLGSSWEEAEAWFAARGASFGAHGDGQQRVMYSRFPNSGLISSEELLLELEFGPDGRLRTRHVRRLNYDL